MNIYERMFRMDLKMLNVRSSYNKVYEQFIQRMKQYTVKTKKDWEEYEYIRDTMIAGAWETFNIEE